MRDRQHKACWSAQAAGNIHGCMTTREFHAGDALYAVTTGLVAQAATGVAAIVMQPHARLPALHCRMLWIIHVAGPGHGKKIRFQQIDAFKH